MDKTDTGATKKVLKRVFSTYGIPSKIKLDNGPPFNSEDLKNWLLNHWSITLMHTTKSYRKWLGRMTVKDQETGRVYDKNETH